MGNPHPAHEGLPGSLARLEPAFRDATQAKGAPALCAPLSDDTACDDRQQPATACNRPHHAGISRFVMGDLCNYCKELFSSLSALSRSSARSAHCTP
jgi:hypothetical protein